MPGLERITFNPDIMGGRACLRGLRVTVALVLNLVANGATTEDILRDYPYLELEDIRQVLRYALWERRGAHRTGGRRLGSCHVHRDHIRF